MIRISQIRWPVTQTRIAQPHRYAAAQAHALQQNSCSIM